MFYVITDLDKLLKSGFIKHQNVYYVSFDNGYTYRIKVMKDKSLRFNNFSFKVQKILYDLIVDGVVKYVI